MGYYKNKQIVTNEQAEPNEQEEQVSMHYSIDEKSGATIKQNERGKWHPSWEVEDKLAKNTKVPIPKGYTTTFEQLAEEERHNLGASMSLPTRLEGLAEWKEKAERLMQTSATGAKKANKGKPRMSLLPAKPLMELAKVLTVGAEVYGDHNWRKGMPYTANTDAALRHLYKFLDGQDTDEDSGLPHLAHAIVDLIFVLEYTLSGTGEDDRFKA